MMRVLQQLVGKLWLWSSLTFIAVSTSLVFFLATTPGTYLSLKALGRLAGGHMTVRHLKGDWVRGFSAQRLAFYDKALRVDFLDVHADIPLNNLLKGRILVKHLNAQAATVDYFSDFAPPAKQKKHRFSMPELQLEYVDIKNIAFQIDDHDFRFRRVQLQTRINNDRVQINALNLWAFDHHSQLRGYIKEHAPYSIVLTGPIYTEDSKPRMVGKLSLQGSQKHYQLTGDVQGKRRLSLTAHLDALSNIRLQLSWKNLYLPEWLQTELALPEGKLEAHGELENLFIHLMTEFDALKQGEKGRLILDAHRQKDVIQAKLQLHHPNINLNAKAHFDESRSPVIQGTVALSQTVGERAGLKNLSGMLTMSGSDWDDVSLAGTLDGLWFNKALHVQGIVHPTHQHIEATLSKAARFVLEHETQKPLRLRLNTDRLETLDPNLQGLQFALTGEATLGETKGKAYLDFSKGHWQPRAKNAKLQETMPVIPIEGGKIQAEYRTGQCSVVGTLRFLQGLSATMQGNIPDFDINAPLDTQKKLRAEFTLAKFPIARLQGIIPDITDVQGNLSIRLAAKGTLALPDITGDVRLEHAAFRIPAAEVAFQNTDINLHSEHQQFTLLGSTSQPGGYSLRLSGDGRFWPKWQASLALVGKALVMNTKYYHLPVAPNLTIRVDKDNMGISGDLVVYDANIAPQSFASSNSLPEDVVFVDETPSEHNSPWDIDLSLKAGQDVKLSLMGLKGLLVGDIHIRKKPQQATRASGELSIQKGRYKAYGQNLRVNQGSLTFSGGLIDNPGIQLRASRRFRRSGNQVNNTGRLFDFDATTPQAFDYGSAVTVGIEISGRVKNPKIRLFAIPAILSQADILSMLILGTPASQANKAQGQLLFSAISALNLDEGGSGLQLMDDLKNKLGFDFNVQSNPSFNQQTNQVTERTSLTLTKTISDRLSISYNVGLSQSNINVLVLKYMLNQFFNIQVSVSPIANGIDLFYTR